MTWGQCDKKGFTCYILSYEVLGILAWVAFIATSVGLTVAIYQILKTKNATKSAQDAINKIETHVAGVNLAYLSAQMNTVMHLIRSEECAVAHIIFVPITRSIRLHAISKKLDSASIESINRTIGKINKQIEWGSAKHSSFNKITANKHLDELLSHLTTWEFSNSETNRMDITDENT